jgi:rfaE bifunctional protein nucleotidyltransferase chain/domain
MEQKKVISYPKISQHIQDYRQKKKKSTVVLCHGCFDIVHPGHIRHLKFAKEQGTFLIVSITPDVCIQKGSSRPYVPEELRAENLAALEIVDAVIIAPGETAIEAIDAILPDIYVKGSEYAVSSDPRFLKEKANIESLGGKVAYSSGDVVFSSSRFIRDNELHTAEIEKLKYICTRYDVTRDLINDTIQNTSGKKILIVGETIRIFLPDVF